MNDTKSQSVAGIYFTLQAVLVLAWWIGMLSSSTVRDIFLREADEARVIRELALPDMVCVGAGSAITALAAFGRRRFAVAVAWCATGAMLYATFYAAGQTILGVLHPPALGLMIPATLASVFASVRLGRRGS